jgi:hypothetical protein
VRRVAPDAAQGVALWLTHLGGSAEQTAAPVVEAEQRGDARTTVPCRAKGAAQRASCSPPRALEPERCLPETQLGVTLELSA